MPKASDKVSLVTRLAESQFRETNLAKDAYRKHIRTFFLAGKHVVSDLTCHALSCKVAEKQKMDQSVLLLSSTIAEGTVDPMLFCYTCNKTFHVKCANLDLNALRRLNGPYICSLCKENPLNDAAVEYYASADWGMGVEKRREQFFKAGSVKENPHLLEEQLTDEEFDKEDEASFIALNEKVDSQFGTIPIEKFKMQKEEFLKFGEQHKRYVEETQRTMDFLKNEIEELKKTRQQDQKVIQTLQGELKKAKEEAQAEKEKQVVDQRRISEKRDQPDKEVPSASESKGTLEDQILTADNLFASLYGNTSGPYTSSIPEGSHNVGGPYTNVSRQQNLGRVNASMQDDFRGPNTVKSHVSFLDTDFAATVDELQNLTLAEKVLLSSTRAQFQSSEAQRAVSEALTAERKRKVLAKITKYKGDARGWLRFQKEVQRHRDIQCYTDMEIKMLILGALEGTALRRVQDMIDVASLDQIMSVLETSFGHSPSIIKAAEEEILKIKLKTNITRSEVVSVNALIQGYFTACQHAKVSTLNSNMLASHILSQLSGTHKLFFRKHYRMMRPNDVTQIPDLDILFTFLEDLAKDLESGGSDEKDTASERKSKPAQLLSISTFKTAEKSSDNYQYEIKDKKVAQYIGYDLEQVKELVKKCACCGGNEHFTVECPEYRSLSGTQKMDMVTLKNLCRNCLLTANHRAGQCSLKLGCGFKIDNARCAQKHHITLHNVVNGTKNKLSNNYTKRKNTNRNTQKALGILNSQTTATRDGTFTDKTSSTESKAASTTNGNVVSYNGIPVPGGSLEMGYNGRPRFAYNVQHVSSSSRRTVKVFRNVFYGPNGRVGGYCIGDSAAEITLMREDLREQLGIEGTDTVIDLQWTDGSIHEIHAKKVDLTIKGIHTDAKPVILEDCYAVDILTLPPRSLDVQKLKKQFPYLQKVEFDSYFDAVPILLIGSPHASCIEAIAPIVEGGEGKPVAIKTKLGWSIYGGAPENYEEPSFNVHAIASAEEPVSNEELSKQLAYFSSIESLGIQNEIDHKTEDEKKAIQLLEEEMKILPNGSVEVPLLWNRVNGTIPTLPNNYHLVLKRQLAQERKLAKHPEQLKAYNDNFRELIREGYVRPATSEDIDAEWRNIWYLPMSLVVNANKRPVKYRNVYDASSKYQGISLNDRLLMGPNLLVDMLLPLFRMRQNKVAFTCDVKSMFHRVFICRRDQQCQRILWRPSPEEPMQIFIQQVMLFGPKSSPCTSQYVKNDTADKWTTSYPEAARTLKQYTYMDDVLTSEPSTEKASQIASQCIAIMKSVNWDLIGFQSNDKEFLKSLPISHVKQEIIPIISGEMEGYTAKVLGCAWDTQSDCFVFQLNKQAFVRLVSECDHRPTKRDQCSTVARIFDILGLIAHFIIRGRILLQRSWKNKIDWDEQISEKDFSDWKKWIEDIDQIAKLRIPRRYFRVNSLTEIEPIELHVFADAGKEAFGAIAYFVATIDGRRQTSLVMAKAKVTPIRLQTETETEIKEMPRLELMACLIASRLAETITKHHEEIKLERYFWTDSKIVHRWITHENHQLQKFAQSPIDEIIQKTMRSEWWYVPSTENPADIATKFQAFDFGDNESKWFKGPQFLLEQKSSWPIQEALNEAQTEIVAQVNAINVAEISFVPSVKLPLVSKGIFSDAEIFENLKESTKSSWTKLLRAIGRGLKILMDGLLVLIKAKAFNNSKAREDLKVLQQNFSILEPLDLERAELFIIRKMQREAYGIDYKLLLDKMPTKNKELNELRAFADTQQVIRINSRVENDVESYPQRFAPLVPRKHPLTRILLMHYHQKYGHVCIDSQLSEIRSKFWIEKLRQALKSIQSNCNYCTLMRSKPHVPLMAPLPDFRTNPSHKPFQVVGLDCTGALTIRRGNFKSKVYILLFTCTLTRFVHVHLLEKMNTLAVLEAIAIFWTCHGPTAEFISDNGRNFVGAARRIRRDQQEESPKEKLSQVHSSVAQTLAEKYSVKWRFIPAYSPWFGGFYESLIKQIKRAIETTIKGRKISRVELSIAIHDAAHRLNCRPLTHCPVESENATVLTPHLLAKYTDGWPLLPSIHRNQYTPAEMDDRLIYHRGRTVADLIMRRFVAEYLPTLTKREKWNKEAENLEIGDLVLLIDPNQTRQPWQRAKIVDTYRGRDGRVRVVDVRLPTGEVRFKYSAQRVAKIQIKQLENAE